METYTKTYGIAEITWKGKKRYCVVCDGRKHHDLNYAKPDFALKKAENFCKSVWKPFTRFDGSQVNFKFEREV